MKKDNNICRFHIQNCLFKLRRIVMFQYKYVIWLSLDLLTYADTQGNTRRLEASLTHQNKMLIKRT